MITIKPKLPKKFSYDGTFFGDLAVTVWEKSADSNTHDDFAMMLDEALGQPSSQLWPVAPPTVSKSYWFSDRRYNPVHRSWPLEELIVKLELAASYGPVSEKTVEQHSSFTIERQRPEDKVVRVSQRGVCLTEWAFEPLYRIHEFDSFAPAIRTLCEIREYLLHEGPV